MRISGPVILATVLLLLGASPSAIATSRHNSEQSERRADPVTASVHYPSKVQTTPTKPTRWTYRRSPDQDMVLLRPSASKGRVPVVLLLHGTIPDSAPVLSNEWQFFLSYGRARCPTSAVVSRCGSLQTEAPF